MAGIGVTDDAPVTSAVHENVPVPDPPSGVNLTCKLLASEYTSVIRACWAFAIVMVALACPLSFSFVAVTPQVPTVR